MSIGEGLARARIQAGLSLAEVSQRTRIRERIIADIENDDYSACGGDFYARGHIRSIARAIGTDPAPFIREYDASQPGPDDVAESEITQPGMAIGAQPGVPTHAEPGPPPSFQPGTPFGAEPGRPRPAEPDWRTSAERDWGTPAERDWGPPADPGWGTPVDSGRTAPAEPDWHASADPGRTAPAEPDWLRPSDPGRTAPAEPDWHTPADPGRPPRTEPGFPFFGESAAAAGARPAPPGGPHQQPPPGPPGGPRRHSLPPPPVPPGRTHRRRPLNWAALLGLVLLAGLGYLAYHIFAGSPRATSSAHAAPARPATSHSAIHSSPAATPTPTPSPSPKPTPRARPLAPAGAQALGVGGSGDNPANARLAIDGNPGTAWRTDWYTTAAFGNLYAGTGLLVDMGRRVTITGAQIRFGPAHGGSFQLRVGRHPSLAGLRPVGHGVAAGVARLRFASPARGRYVLIWFTSLPVDPTGNYRASVYDVRLQGR